MHTMGPFPPPFPCPRYPQRQLPQAYHLCLADSFLSLGPNITFCSKSFLSADRGGHLCSPLYYSTCFSLQNGSPT